MNKIFNSRSMFCLLPLFGALIALGALLLLPIAPVKVAAASEAPALLSSVTAANTITETLPAIGWATQAVLRERRFGTPSLAVDTSGHIHIAYGGNQLFYAYFDGAAWQYQVVDSSGGINPCLKLDAQQRPIISYYVSSIQEIRLASWTGTEWLTATVAHIIPSILNASTSLALDANGNPHILYNADYAALAYASRLDGNWITEMVVTDTIWGTSFSLALDLFNNPALTYATYNGQMLVHYVHWNGSTWDRQDVGYGEGSSLAFDAAGTPHVSYIARSTELWQDSVRYASWNGSGWDEQTVAVYSYGGLTSYTTLALASNGAPHIVFRESFLHYAHWNGESWSDENLGGNLVWQASLVLDAAGNPYLAYCDPIHWNGYGQSCTLTYAYKLADVWAYVQVDEEEFLMSYLRSLVLDSTQQPHIAFSRQYQPVYASWSGTGWDIQPIGAADEAGIEISSMALALDGHDRPHVVYTRQGDNRVRYATWDDSQWLTETISMPTYVYGPTLALAIDLQDNPQFCWSNLNASGAVYAHKVAGEWFTQTLETGYPASCSIDIDTAGMPHLAYIGVDGLLKHARWDGADWLIETVDYTTSYFHSVDLQIGPDGWPRIAYLSDEFAGLGYQVKYAQWDGLAWQVSRVPVDNTWTNWMEMALNPAGEPSLLYNTGSGQYFARLSDRTWQIERVAPPVIGSGSTFALAVDSSNRPHVLNLYCNPNSYGMCGGYDLVYQIGMGASFSVTPQDGYIPLEVTFTNRSFGDFTTYEWDFDDGGASNEENPAHVYAFPGVYTPTLTVSGPDGTYTLSKPAAITARVLTDFSVTPAQGYAPLDVAFTNRSQGDFTSVLWDFGDGLTSSDAAPTHTYSAQGMYTVTLTVSGPSGSYQAVKPRAITILKSVDALILPGAGWVLSYTTLAGEVVTLQFPPEAVTQTTRITYTPLFSVTYPYTTELAYLGLGFDLSAVRVDSDLGETPLDHLDFAAPVTVTLQYINRANEDTLALRTFDGANWLDAAVGSYDRHPDENWLSLSIDHTGRFAVVGKLMRVFMPVMYRPTTWPDNKR